MQTLTNILLAVGTLASLILHYLGKKSATAEKLADEVDAGEAALKTVAPSTTPVAK